MGLSATIFMTTQHPKGLRKNTAQNTDKNVCVCVFVCGSVKKLNNLIEIGVITLYTRHFGTKRLIACS
jgi:hypothetical protein